MREEYRQAAHLFFGFIIAFFIFFADKKTAVYVMAIVVFLSVAISDAVTKNIHVPLFSEIIQKLERNNTVPGKGTILFFISTLTCLVLFEKNIVFAAILVLAVLDSVTTIIGINFGRTKIYKKKSLEGTASGIIAGFIVLIFLINPQTALVASALAGITELISPVDDNLTIPLVVCIVLSIL
ncbi:dolichol kinase [Methanomicrobium sp. W14]|uniref:diacylglycerol/polyprenol kinase family protein n=1 Tax=Methanomicrobium sp. W14 TaxID=2817839 RepID=UPI001AE6E7E4|nr:hypothetical protein [Methanomicrobium sp. W14]MBP2132156.1 dolichol kinase [Methanomicrobium sp. W14]